MGLVFTSEGLDRALKDLAKDRLLYGPKCFEGESEYSDQDSIRYGPWRGVGDMVLDLKSNFSFKEIIMPISETLFYFTEEEFKEADPYNKKEAYVFLRSCDLHALKRLDAIYLDQGQGPDYFYKRLRDKVRFILIGCQEAFENCFCVDMGTNKSEDYMASLDEREGSYYMDIKDPDLEARLRPYAEKEEEVSPAYVTQTHKEVRVPEEVDPIYISKKEDLWEEYDSRCIACGRCNFTCPTCTCFSMQDIFYRDNAKAGERRRVWASCMVDGYTDVAGGGHYRAQNGQRMRFKALHKIHDFKERHGFNMCTGCGRCDDACPEYISFSHTINKVAGAMEEKLEDDEEVLANASK